MKRIEGNELIIEKWHTLDNISHFEIIGRSDKEGYTGKILDMNSNVLYMVGMPQDYIGFSYNYDITYSIVEKLFNQLKSV